MEIINQLAAPLAQSAQVEQQQSSEKTQQIRRAQVARKNIAAVLDTFEHQVESTEAVTPVHDEQQHDQTPPRPRKPRQPASQNGQASDPSPSIDVTA